MSVCRCVDVRVVDQHHHNHRYFCSLLNSQARPQCTFRCNAAFRRFTRTMFGIITIVAAIIVTATSVSSTSTITTTNFAHFHNHSSSSSSSSLTYELDGTPNAYLQFPSWYFFFSRRSDDTDANARSSKFRARNLDQTCSLSFEFKCDSFGNGNRPPVGGLLLYTDDQTGPGGVFLEIKLLSETNLRIRIDDGNRGTIRTKNIIELRQGINFTDGQWHRFELIRHLQPPTAIDDYTRSDSKTRSETITVKIDSELIHKQIELSKSLSSESVSTITYEHASKSMFFGGLPQLYRDRHLSQLALTTAAYELHFRGAIRNVLYATIAGSSERDKTKNEDEDNSDDITNEDIGDEDIDLRIQSPLYTGGLLSREKDLSRHRNSEECDDNQHGGVAGVGSSCQHGGYCYPTQSGIFCDCTVTDFEGPYCQKERNKLEATFRGEYLAMNHIDLPHSWAFVSTTESFEFAFRTKHANGLLLFINGGDAGNPSNNADVDSNEDDENYLMIGLRDAALWLTIKRGGGEASLGTPIEKIIQPSKVRFDDNQWHTVQISRKIREISLSSYFCHFSITVDGIYTQHGSLAVTSPYFVSKLFYVGGIASTITARHRSIADIIAHNSGGRETSNDFMGCLRKIVYNADNIRLDLLALIDAEQQRRRIGTNYMTANNSLHKSEALIRFYRNSHHHHHHQQQPQQRYEPSLSCQDSIDKSADPITFTTADSYLKIANRWKSTTESSLSLKLRTNEPNGVLLYSASAAADTADINNSNNNSNGTGYDFFALELLDGHLYLLQYLGASPVKVKASEKRIDDGLWHSVFVNRSARNGQVMIDGETRSDFILPGSSDSYDLYLGDSLYVGGFPRFTGNRLTYTPPQLWSAAWSAGYIGCIQDLVIDNRAIDLASLARRQDSGSIKPSCYSSATTLCAAKPCQNGGVCIEGWNRYSCDCSATSYTGSVCAKNAATLNFNGEQYFTINLPEVQRTQVESIDLRFRTSRPSGLLFTTRSRADAAHHLTMTLESGAIRIDINYGEEPRERTLKIGNALNDDQWHTVRVYRRGRSVEIEIDRRLRESADLTGQHLTLHVDSIHVGAYINTPKSSHSKHFTGFVGTMQNFIINGQAYFEKVRDGHLSSGSIRMTAKLGKKDRILHNVATFKSKYTFVGLSQLKAYSTLNIYFQFKTREANGLLFFNGGGGDDGVGDTDFRRTGMTPRHDFIAVELIAGQLHYIFDLGDGARRLQSKARVTLNDNRWHAVTLGRPSLHEHTMLIDDSMLTTIHTVTGADRNLHLDLNGLLYVGGVRDTMWATLPKAIKSKHGFEGCLASIDLNGETFNLAGGEALIPSTLVQPGCSAPITRCSSTACANRGICVQLWNSYTCDCDLTTYSGPTCADESTAYQFGPNPGLVTFMFDDNNRPDTRNDLLALGFLTTHKNGALVRVDSGTTADYLQLELIDGNVLVVYNLGTEDIDIGELGFKVNDGKYHIVRLTRSGQNSTLQIDNHNVLTRSPSGKQMNIFNSHARIEIGGHKNVLRGTIEKPFAGIIAGLVFNGHRLLDMAAEDDPRVKIEGDVELMISIGNQDSTLTTPSSIDRLNHQMQSEPKSPTRDGNDDLIYSGAGSGCFDVQDDEECARVTQEGSGDELITPVYVAVSHRFRSTTPSVPTWARNRPDIRKQCTDDDDDDCTEGSGTTYDGPDSIGPSNSGNRSSSYDTPYYYSTSDPGTWTTWTAPTVAPINRPPTYGGTYPTGPPYSYGSDYNVHRNREQQMYPIRPKSTAPSWTKPVYSVNGPPSRPFSPHIPNVDPQSPPEIYDVPLNIPSSAANESTIPPPMMPEVLNRSSNDRTVMIIGMIAICLIVVVIIAPIVLFFKVRLQSNDAAYKVETFGGPKFGSTLPIHGGVGAGGYPPFSPVVRATSVAGITGHPGLLPPGMMQQPGLISNTLGRSTPRPGTRPGTPTDRKKDPHEWYV